MKKILCLTLAIVLLILPIGLSYASFASPFVSRLNLAGATVGASGVNVAAKVLGTTSTGANVASWVSLLIPGSNVAKIAGGVLAVGGALAADYLMIKGAAWFAAKGITYDGDNYLMTETVRIPDGHLAGDYAEFYPKGTTGCDTSGCFARDGQGKGIFVNSTKAYYVADAWRNSHCLGAGSVISSGDGFMGAYYYYYKDACVSGASYNALFFYPKPTGGTEQTFSQNIGVDYVESLFKTDYSNGIASTKPLGLAAVEVAGASLDNPNHPVNANSTSKSAIAAALAASINANQLANLEAAATPNVGDNVLPDTAPNVNDMTPAQIAAAVQAALAGQGLSASQIAAAIAAAQQAAASGMSAAEAQAAIAAALSAAGLSSSAIGAATAAALAGAGLATNAGVETAVKNAIDDETGITPPTDPTPLIPDKLSLTAVLTAFVAAIQQLPIMQTLNGLTINTSGSSVLSLTFLGQSYSYDAGGMQSALNTIGSALLGLTTIFSFLGIFRS